MRNNLSQIIVTLIVPTILIGAGGCDPNMTPGGEDGSPTSVNIESGGRLDFPAGSLPENANVSVATASEPLLPLGVTPAGDAIRIDIDQRVSRPFELRLPTPTGANARQASIFQIADDGATTLLSTTVEGNELVATTAHFSRLPSGTAKRIPLQDAIIDGIKAAVGIRDAVTDVPSISPPRQGAIVGPDFLSPGETGLYVLTGFEDATAESLETNWTAFGDVELAVPGGGSTTTISDLRIVAVTANDEGRVDLTVDYTDPFSGQRGFAAKRISVAADTSDDLTLLLVDGELERTVNEEAPGLFVSIINSSNGPFNYSWDYTDGTRGMETDNSSESVGVRTATHTFRNTGTFNVVITATDAGGRSGSLTVPVTVRENILSLVVGGPLSAPIAGGPFATTEYTFRFSGGTPAYTLRWELLPTSQRGGSETAESEVADGILFSEPGAYLLTATVTDTQGSSAVFTKPVTVTGGSGLNLTVSAETLTAEPGQAITFPYSIVGGVLVVNGQRRPYQLEFNWNDGGVSTLNVDSDSTRSAVSDSLVHRFDEVGTYDVTARVVDGTGEFRERVITIEVTEDGEPTGDDMPTDDMAECNENNVPPDPDCFAVINITNQGSASSSSVFNNDTGNFGVGLSVDGNSSTSWFSDGNPDGQNDSEVFTWTFGENADIFLARVETDPEQFQGGGSFGFASVTVIVRDLSGTEVFNSGAIGLAGSRVDISEAFPAGLVGHSVQLILVGHQDESCGGFAELRVFGFELIQPEPESP